MAFAISNRSSLRLYFNCLENRPHYFTPLSFLNIKSREYSFSIYFTRYFYIIFSANNSIPYLHFNFVRPLRRLQKTKRFCMGKRNMKIGFYMQLPSKIISLFPRLPQSTSTLCHASVHELLSVSVKRHIQCILEYLYLNRESQI